MKRTLVAILSSLWVIFAVAALARLEFIWSRQRAIPQEVLATVPFAQENGNIALALSQGKGFSNVFRAETGPTAWLTPVYPLLLAAIFRVFGAFTYPAFLAAVLLNALFSSATCIPIYFTGKKIGGVSLGALAAWLWALYPQAVMIPFEWIWDTSLSALLGALLLWSSLALAESSRARNWYAYGLLWGVSLLANPALGAALPFLLGWLVYYRSPAKSRPAWKLPALSLTLAAVVCLPWTIRNYAAFHRFVPLRSSLPFELWLGNNDIFDPKAIRGIQRITKFEQIRLYSQLGENAFMDEKWRRATAFIRTHPTLELRLTGRRVVATWLGTEHPLADFLCTDSLFVRAVFLCNLLVLAGTLSGLAVLFLRRDPHAFPLAVFPVFFPVVYYLTHTSLRYRHPADPALLVLWALTLLTLFGVLRPRAPA